MTPPLVEETIVTLSVNGRPACQWRCSPADLEALAVGRMFIDALISHPDDAHLVITRDADDSVTVNARITTPSIVRANVRNALPIPQGDPFVAQFRELFNTTDARHPDGGMHAAAASDGQRIIKQLEDVGRHNVIDKVVGALLLDRLNPGDYGLLISSRVSGEIAAKCVRAGFAWLASRSIPTTLAARIASQAHMPIIGRAPARDAQVYL